MDDGNGSRVRQANDGCWEDRSTNIFSLLFLLEHTHPCYPNNLLLTMISSWNKDIKVTLAKHHPTTNPNGFRAQNDLKCMYALLHLLHTRMKDAIIHALRSILRDGTESLNAKDETGQSFILHIEIVINNTIRPWTVDLFLQVFDTMARREQHFASFNRILVLFCSVKLNPKDVKTLYNGMFVLSRTSFSLASASCELHF